MYDSKIPVSRWPALRRGQIHLRLLQVASHQDDPGSERHRKQPFKSHQKSQTTCTDSRMLCQHKCTVKVKGGLGWNNATCSPSDWSTWSRFWAMVLMIRLNRFWWHEDTIYIRLLWWSFVSYNLECDSTSLCLDFTMPHIHNQTNHFTSGPFKRSVLLDGKNPINGHKMVYWICFMVTRKAKQCFHNKLSMMTRENKRKSNAVLRRHKYFS